MVMWCIEAARCRGLHPSKLTTLGSAPLLSKHIRQDTLLLRTLKRKIILSLSTARYVISRKIKHGKIRNIMLIYTIIWVGVCPWQFSKFGEQPKSKARLVISLDLDQWSKLPPLFKSWKQNIFQEIKKSRHK